MNEKDYSLKLVIAHRFYNYSYPDLERHISTYLDTHPDKLEIYRTTNVTSDIIIRELLKHNELFKNRKNVNTNSIMEIIIPLIERSYVR